MKTRSRDTRNIVMVAIIAVIGYWVWSHSLEEEPWSVRSAKLYAAALAAEPLIDAIRRYVEQRKEPPMMLDDLIPRYLPSIPDTGIRACEQFKYASFGSDRVFVMWYDLGPLHGRPMAKPGRYPDGDPNHSILVFTIGEGGQVIDARLDRMPKDIKGVEFDPLEWAAGTRRAEMAMALPDDYQLSRMNQVALEELLGMPDGFRVMRDTPWELRINCPRGFLERDILLYWPGEKYPQQIYGASTILLGRWLYVQQ